MADLSITATAVVQTDGATLDGFVAALTTITAGQVVYLDSTTNTFKLAQADGTAAEAAARGIALNGGAAGQPIKVQNTGKLNPGATVAVGIVYVVSAAAGSICPITDLVSTNKVTILGIGSLAAELTLMLNVTGIIKA